MKEIYKKQEDYFKSPEGEIMNSLNQFSQFNLSIKFSGFEKIKEIIQSTDLKNLEDYILLEKGIDAPKVINEIRNWKPEVFDEYNNFIKRLKAPDLTYEEYLKIVEDSKKLTLEK